MKEKLKVEMNLMSKLSSIINPCFISSKVVSGVGTFLGIV
jgi:hypothetical protein